MGHSETFRSITMTYKLQYIRALTGLLFLGGLHAEPYSATVYPETPAVQPIPKTTPCVCGMILWPVICGSNKYVNHCLAECAGEMEPCETDLSEMDMISNPTERACPCPRIYLPVVCGDEMKEYNSICEARCQGETVCKSLESDFLMTSIPPRPVAHSKKPHNKSKTQNL